MTNLERLTKLAEAQNLIREVEFSYPHGDPIRRTIYNMIVNTFSCIGSLHVIIEELENNIKKDK